ncbi:hypothetical protein YC2023_114728 [Brassica napus]
MSLRCSKEAVPVNIDRSSSSDVRDIISLGCVRVLAFLMLSSSSSRMALRFSDFILCPLLSMFSHLFAIFIVVRVSGGLPFCHVCTLGLDSVFLCVCLVGLEGCFWSQAWALVSRWLASILIPSGCFSSSHASLGISVLYGVSLLELCSLLSRALWFFAGMYVVYVLV